MNFTYLNLLNLTKELNKNLNESKNAQMPSRLGTALGAIIAFLFIIFGLFGDTLIIIAILRKRELRNNLVNIFIVSLQLNDIFNICFNQFMVGLGYTFMKWYGPYIICELFVYTSIICTGCLLWHHALISIHRYLVVVCNQSTSYMGMTPKLYVLLSLIIARLIPTLVCAPALLNRNMTEYSTAALRCMLAPKTGVLQNLLIVVVNMAIPCVIIFYCFARIFTRVHNVSKNIRRSTITSVSNNNNNNNNRLSTQTNDNFKLDIHKANSQQITAEKKISKVNLIVFAYKLNKNRNSAVNFASTMSTIHREIQISKMFAIIFTVFLFGYLPYGIIRLIDARNNLHPDVYILLTVLFIISISVSPIIYGLMNNQIRMQCFYLLRVIFKCDPLDKYSNVVNNARMSRVSSFFVSPVVNRVKMKKSLSNIELDQPKIVLNDSKNIDFNVINKNNNIEDKQDEKEPTFFNCTDLKKKKQKLSSSAPNLSTEYTKNLNDFNNSNKKNNKNSFSHNMNLNLINVSKKMNSCELKSNGNLTMKSKRNKKSKKKFKSFSNKENSLILFRKTEAGVENAQQKQREEDQQQQQSGFYLLKKLRNLPGNITRSSGKLSKKENEISNGFSHMNSNCNATYNSSKSICNKMTKSERSNESLSPESIKNRLMIDSNDDGGVYKGPAM